MKKYNDFINEHQKFQEKQYVKRKSDGKIGIITNVGTYSDGVKRFMKYSVDFNIGSAKYLARDIEKATPDEIETFKNVKKFNL